MSLLSHLAVKVGSAFLAFLTVLLCFLSHSHIHTHRVSVRSEPLNHVFLLKFNPVQSCLCSSAPVLNEDENRSDI